MAGEIVVGKVVQAVDELGHWLRARVVAVEDEKFRVTFPGYPGCACCDRWVSKSQVRLPYAKHAIGKSGMCVYLYTLVFPVLLLWYRCY